MRTAIVIGATGLVGTQLIRLLFDDNRFDKVVVLGRRSLAIKNLKLEEHIIDFDKPETWQHLLKGDLLFSALGTTLKQAGSKPAQYKIDYTYQFQAASGAAHQGVPVYVLVSAATANPDAALFYTRMKGELERDIKKLPFKSINIIQPGLLVGKRQKERFGEKLGFQLLRIFNSIGLFKTYRPIGAGVVAQAMINAGIAAAGGIHVFSLEQVFTLAGTKASNKG